MREVRIVCDAESHAPKVAVVGIVSWRHDGRPSWFDGEGAATLRGDEVLDSRRMYGGVQTRPDWEYFEEHKGHTRTRLRFRCKLCGLTVPLRDEKATRLAEGLRNADVQEVPLSALAAILG